jgi:hypothetical protein
MQYSLYCKLLELLGSELGSSARCLLLRPESGIVMIRFDVSPRVQEGV